MTRPSCAALHRLTQPSIPPWVVEVSTSNEGDWWNMCIPNKFTAPRGSLVAYMLHMELKWEEVASPHKRNDTVESSCAGKLQVTCKVPLVGHSSFERHYINA